ncbi:SDR family NAD(P)-dependent oxidoreductase [Nocardia sp. NPDC023852]|uniref:SDR family NAD(P)-dependent oxidoreductase n=1 Tax=Nocardia sp. NPDC023852 TaxID=3154697 RepID=UPI0033E30155
MSTRVAIVTGGSRGIGRRSAERLAADGMAVVIAYAADTAEADAAVVDITTAGGQAVAARADVADEAAVTALFDTAERQFGGVDVVVNAAGTMTLAPVADLALDAMDRMHRTNIRGTFVVDQQANKPSPAWPHNRRSNASVHPTTSPRSSHSWPARADGSTDRSSAPMVPSSDPLPDSPPDARRHEHDLTPHNRTNRKQTTP